MKFALWSVTERCYIGDETGPKTFPEELLARAAATIATHQCGRLIVPKALPEAPLHRAGSLFLQKSTYEALMEIENKIVDHDSSCPLNDY